MSKPPLSKGAFLAREAAIALGYTGGALAIGAFIGSSVGFYVRDKSETKTLADARFRLPPHHFVPLRPGATGGVGDVGVSDTSAGPSHLHCTVRGEGRPIVFLEGSSGATTMTWGKVMDEVSKHTTVVAYDRAGLGVSPEGPTPRTAERQSEELLHLIRAVQTQIDGRREGLDGVDGVDGDGDGGGVVLVGHGTGCLSTRLLAARCGETGGGARDVYGRGRGH
jgi:pimeloyl-ACP methyl ester carboxylesterase